MKQIRRFFRWLGGAHDCVLVVRLSDDRNKALIGIEEKGLLRWVGWKDLPDVMEPIDIRLTESAWVTP